MVTGKKKFKAYSWNHESKDVERVDDIEFECMHTGNFKILLGGKHKRYDVSVFNSYEKIRVGEKYVFCFDLEQDVDIDKMRNTTIDYFVKSNESKIGQLYDSIWYEVNKLKKKNEYWELIRNKMHVPEGFWEQELNED